MINIFGYWKLIYWVWQKNHKLQELRENLNLARELSAVVLDADEGGDI